MNESGTTTAEAPAFDETLEKLAALSTVEYDKVRKDEAERWGVRLGTLDKEVEKLRKSISGVDANQRARERLGIVEIEPWDAPVESGKALLDEILRQLKRFVVASDTVLRAVTLWIVFTYLLDDPGVVTSPRLAILSPEKRCGKSVMLSLIDALAFRPIAASNISPAAIYRLCNVCTLTILIDEADTFIGVRRPSERSEDIRGILNSGHTRTSAYIIRDVPDGDAWLPQKFSTWSAFAFAAIGNLPDTLMDRSIKVPMRRKLKTEKIGKLRARDERRIEAFNAVARRIKRWASDNAASIFALEIKPPESLNDRAGDNWEPLLAIAEIAGGDWPERARDVAETLSVELNEQTYRTMVLRDMRAIFEAAKDGDSYPNLSSEEICTALVGFEGQPWAEYGKLRKPITKNQLASLLRPFGISPDTVKPSNLKGYKYKDLQDLFARYLDEGAAVPATSKRPKSSKRPPKSPPKKPKRRKFARDYKDAA